MKKIAIFFFFFSALSYGQEWTTDLNDAKSVAAKENQKIVLVFQGSDWCAPCIRLDKQIWSTQTFQKYAEEHFVMLQADFPRKKKNALPPQLVASNAKLAESYNPNGIFPFVVVLDKNGKVLGQTTFKKMSPEAYIQHLESFKG